MSMTKDMNILGAVALSAVLVLGGANMAQAGGGGGFGGGGGYGDRTSDRMMDDDDGWMGDGWMDTAMNIVGDFYLGVRGKGFLLLDEAEDVNAELGNYTRPESPLAATVTDFSDVLDGTETSPTELSGGFALAVGYDVPIDLPGGGLRVEFEYDYQLYGNEACFANIGADQADIELGLDSGLPLATGGAALADRSGSDADALALQAQARAVAVANIPTSCEDVNNPVHGFLGNIFYDIDMADALDMMGVDGSIVSGLAFNVGVGFGYQLVDAETEARTVVAIDKLPVFDPSSAAGGTTQSITFTDTEDLDDQVDGNDPVTAVATELAESGFLLPVYAGFSYSLEEMANLPVVIEATYRYDAIAPDGVGAHTFGGGLRYHF